MVLNRSRAEEFMRRHGLDALVATSPVNVTYFTDYACWLASGFKEYMVSPGGSSERAQQSFALLPLEGEAALVIEPLWAVNACDLWVTDLVLAGDAGFEPSDDAGQLPEPLPRILELLQNAARSETPIEGLAQALAARGLGRGRIGIELEGLPAEMRDELAGLLPQAAIADCTNLLRLIRAVKSTEELGRLERSAEIAEQAAWECFAGAEPGRPLSELGEVFRARIAQLGADFDHFAFSPRGLGIATEPRYVLGEGDVLFVDFGCIYRGYYSDSGTTLCASEPSAPTLERYDALRATIEAGVATMRPGILASTVRAAMWEALTAGGITDSFPHGHGLGLEVRDYPIVVADNRRRIRDGCVDVPSDLPLEEGMVVNLEVPVFTLGESSIHCEQSFVITAEGCRPLTEQLREMPAVPAVSSEARS
jgi:Xaa-Pro dipeptidase